VDLLWSEATAVFVRTNPQQRDVFCLTGSGWEPPVDILETETGLIVIVALPGVRPDDMEIVIGDGELMVRGSRRWPTPRRAARVHRVELPHGRFERRLPLPHGAYQLAGREHTDGCLVLTLKTLA
jgi:HSP20 family molecular chaperone IbpA